MGYAVLHLDKATGNDAGMSAHIERTVEPKNADKNRTHLNSELIIFPEGVKNRTDAIQYRIKEAGIKRKITDNQVRAIRILLSGSPKDMKRIVMQGQLSNWCNDNLEWLKKTYGQENLVSAVLHMDESTPHIHATVIPIVTGERRKAKKEKTEGKRKYRKNNTVRLCADDVMARNKLKSYQDSYAKAMNKYGLQRGIEGSEAKHIATSQYYKELMIQTGSLQENIDVLLMQEKLVKENLSQIKKQIKTEELKSTAVNMATSAMDVISSSLSKSKIKKQEQEVERLKKENKQLCENINVLNQKLESSKKEHDKVINNLKQEIKIIYERFPMVREVFRIENLCRIVGFREDMIKRLLSFTPFKFKGYLYSPEHKERFKTDNSIAHIEKEIGKENKLHLLIDKVDVMDWFKMRYIEMRESLQEERNKGIKR